MDTVDLSSYHAGYDSYVAPRVPFDDYIKVENERDKYEELLETIKIILEECDTNESIVEEIKDSIKDFEEENGRIG